MPDLPATRRASPAVRPYQARVTVEPGDSLWLITRRQLRFDARDSVIATHVAALYQLNRHQIGDDPDFILPGQRLISPWRDQ